MKMLSRDVQTAIAMLSFAEADIAEVDWPALLAFTDRIQLSLLLPGGCNNPDLQLRLARNLEKRRRMSEATHEILCAFRRAGVECVVLKGCTHSLGFGIAPERRLQYDIDLLCPNVNAGTAVLAELGYRPHRAESLSDQHLPPMVKPFTWKWSGDYFDPDMPIAVDLHTRAWNSEADRLELPGMRRFWERRKLLRVDGIEVPALGDPDRLAFAAVHALRHILRNDAKPAHVYEIASLLHTRADEDEFWNKWHALHDPELRRVQAVVFHFASTWFHCRMPAIAQQEVHDLPARVRNWFAEFAFAPLVNLSTPNKDVVWLHLALLPRMRDRLHVLNSRLLPARQAVTDGAAFWPRLRYHAGALAPALLSGLRLARRPKISSTASQISDL